jgi:rubredoxin
MSSYDSCPNCGREAKKAFSSNWFPVYKCSKCGTEYCEKCGGETCPDCGSSKYSEVGKVYA